MLSLQLARILRILGIFIGMCIIAQIASDLTKTGGARSLYRPLVAGDQWIVEGNFPRLDMAISPLEIPSEMTGQPGFALWRSWAPETNGTVGAVHTPAFAPPRFMAVPIVGFPLEAEGFRLYGQCADTGENWDIAVQRTNTQWSTVYLDMNRYRCASVSLHATSAGNAYYVGIGTPFEVSKGAYAAHAGFGARAMVALLTWGVVAAIVFCAALLIRNVDVAMPVGMVALAAGGMAVLALASVPAGWRRVGILFALIAMVRIGYALWVAVKHRPSFRGMMPVVEALAVWLCVSLFYLAIISMSDNGAGSWSINGVFAPLRWSTDNQLPYFLAEKLYEGRPIDEMQWGPWLAADRTPLLAGILLAMRYLFIGFFGHVLGSDFIPTAYMASSIVILTSWVPVLAWISRANRLNGTIILLLAVTSPFFLFNSVFTWGKILGGTYTLVAFGLLHRLSHGEGGPRALALVAACASAAYLSHASNAFAVLPLAVFYCLAILRQGPAAIVVASAFAITIVAPWLYWQIHLQPGGNALTRYLLTGDFGFNRRDQSIVADVLSVYSALGVGGWLESKWQAITACFGIFLDWTSFPEVAKGQGHVGLAGASRVQDFFVLARSVWILPVALFSVWAVGSRQQVDTSLWRDPAIVGVCSLVLTVLISLSPVTTHTLPYGAVMLLFFAAAEILARASAWLQLAVVTMASSYFVAVWIVSPHIDAGVINWNAVAIVFELALLLVIGAALAFNRNSHGDKA